MTDVNPKDKKMCIAVLWPFLWIGSFSLHPKIGGYLYSKTVFPYMAFTFIVEFTKTLNAACLERPYRHLPPEFEILLPLFPTFCLAFIANIHRFRWKEWRTSTLVEFDLSDIVVYLKQLSLLILIQKTDDDVDAELHEMFLVVVQCLYIITGYATRADLDDKASKYHTICTEKNANMLRQFKKNEMKIHRQNQLMMQCTETPIIDEIHASVQTLFDPNPINQARFSIYNEIATRSNECRAVLDVQCGCGNAKCSKGRSQSKYCCSKCRLTAYCSRKCQKYDWNRGDHKEQCQEYFGLYEVIESLARCSFETYESALIDKHENAGASEYASLTRGMARLLYLSAKSR